VAFRKFAKTTVKNTAEVVSPATPYDVGCHMSQSATHRCAFERKASGAVSPSSIPSIVSMRRSHTNLLGSQHAKTPVY